MEGQEVWTPASTVPETFEQTGVGEGKGPWKINQPKVLVTEDNVFDGGDEMAASIGESRSDPTSPFSPNRTLDHLLSREFGTPLLEQHDNLVSSQWSLRSAVGEMRSSSAGSWDNVDMRLPLSYFRALCVERMNSEDFDESLNEMEAVMRLLEEKERDLELAARIGQTLLADNRKLKSQVDSLEEQLGGSEEKSSQLQHELTAKNELLRIYSRVYDSQEDISLQQQPQSPDKDGLGLALNHHGYIGERSSSNGGRGSGEDTMMRSEAKFYDGDGSWPGKVPFATHVKNLENMHRKLQTIEEENLKLRLEMSHIKTETIDLEDREKELVSDALRQLNDANSNVKRLADELEKKTDECMAQQEDVTNLLSQVSGHRKAMQKLSLENEELALHLSSSQDAQDHMRNQLAELQERYQASCDMLNEARVDMKELEKRVKPRLHSVSREHSITSGSETLSSSPGRSRLSSFGLDARHLLQENRKQMNNFFGGPSTRERLAHQKRVLETVRAASKKLRNLEQQQLNLETPRWSEPEVDVAAVLMSNSDGIHGEDPPNSYGDSGRLESVKPSRRCSSPVESRVCFDDGKKSLSRSAIESSTEKPRDRALTSVTRVSQVDAIRTISNAGPVARPQHLAPLDLGEANADSRSSASCKMSSPVATWSSFHSISSSTITRVTSATSSQKLTSSSSSSLSPSITAVSVVALPPIPTFTHNVTTTFSNQLTGPPHMSIPSPEELVSNSIDSPLLEFDTRDFSASDRSILVNSLTTTRSWPATQPSSPLGRRSLPDLVPNQDVTPIASSSSFGLASAIINSSSADLSSSNKEVPKFSPIPTPADIAIDILPIAENASKKLVQVNMKKSDVVQSPSKKKSGKTCQSTMPPVVLGRPGLPGTSDLDNSLSRLSMRQALLHNRHQQFITARRKRLLTMNTDLTGSTTTLTNDSHDIESLSSSVLSLNDDTDSEDLNRRNASYPGRLEIVKPIEGSFTLKHWQQLARPQFGGLMESRPGIQPFALRAHRQTLAHTRGGGGWGLRDNVFSDFDDEELYSLSDFEVDDDDDVELQHFMLGSENSNAPKDTITNTRVLHLSDSTGSIPNLAQELNGQYEFLTPTKDFSADQILNMFVNHLEKPPPTKSPTTDSPVTRRGNDATSTFSTDATLARRLGERGSRTSSILIESPAAGSSTSSRSDTPTQDNGAPPCPSTPPSSPVQPTCLPTTPPNSPRPEKRPSLYDFGFGLLVSACENSYPWCASRPPMPSDVPPGSNETTPTVTPPPSRFNSLRKKSSRRLEFNKRLSRVSQKGTGGFLDFLENLGLSNPWYAGEESEAESYVLDGHLIARDDAKETSNSSSPWKKTAKTKKRGMDGDNGERDRRCGRSVGGADNASAGGCDGSGGGGYTSGLNEILDFKDKRGEKSGVRLRANILKPTKNQFLSHRM